MKRNIITAIALVTLFFCACTPKDEGEHFFTDEQQRTDIKNDLKAKKKHLPDGHLFDILSNKELNTREREGLQFLYAYMPVGDIADYPGEYHLENLRLAFRAKDEMPWGKDIPEREFNHFVVPVRVNNENLDAFRATYYEELKDRVKGLSLHDAVLEVNHWCHEHVSYKGSDSRTSAPMATVKTSWGRCGEESTLLVTALRTVGIPARQVYTPRWAHCDDNHAWVEAYVDGGWHFLGACEPEPVLDLGWFNEPASRALLLHTKVFGRYQGPEEVISQNNNYTEINLIDHYAETAKTTFTVSDNDLNPLANVPVEFKIYNYAEYCTVATKYTDENGQTWLTAGLGTMMAFASKDGKFGFKVFQSGDKDEVKIVLNHTSPVAETMTYDLIPPEPNCTLPEVSPEMRAENDRRIAHEDSIRNAYIQSCKEAQTELIAKTGNKTLCSIYEKTWGNYQTIADFMQYAQERGRETDAVRMLESLSDKDLRDVSLDVLMDLFDGNVISPRVSNEMLVPYRKTLSTFFSKKETQRYHDNPTLLVEWVKQHIRVNDDLNPQRIPISPIGVLKARVADKHSRDIFFVAMARCLGLTAQINPITGNVEYMDQDTWKKVNFDANETESTPTTFGYLDIQYQPTEDLPDPKYYSNFSIKKFNGERFDLLAFDAQDPGIDDGLSLSSFEHPLTLESGYYIITGGNRLCDGNVLAHSQMFILKENDTTHVNLVIRQPVNTLKVLGKMDTECPYIDATTGESSFLSSNRKKGYIVGFLDQGSEPTSHVMQDFAALYKQFNRTGMPIYLLFDNTDDYKVFQMKSFDNLPETIIYGIQDGNLKKKTAANLKLKGNNPPLFLIVNAKGEVVFSSQGYSIKLGDQLLRTLYKLY
ncbi:MAG: transglutaminase domain-containing protein [Bacteroidales bacterium]|nr:transglutaminase domain-containing protein [Bacteroidales bacterium]